MIGKHRVVVYNSKLRYDFTVKRKFTILRGSSATGKTCLCNMLMRTSTVKECDVQLFVLPSSNWEVILKNISNQIIFVDEDFPYMTSHEFATAMFNSDNYFVLITREKLSSIPYSVNEIYGLMESKAEALISKSYTTNVFYNLYDDIEFSSRFKPDLLLTEDSNSGYTFFNLVKRGSIACKSANGKSKVYQALLDNLKDYNNICLIVDGAAFGSEIDEIISFFSSRVNKNIILETPESFEFLLLNAVHDIFDVNIDWLSKTYNYCSRDFLLSNNFITNDDSETLPSWERFYTKLLVGITKSDSKFRYSKFSFNRNYLEFEKEVLRQLPDISIT